MRSSAWRWWNRIRLRIRWKSLRGICASTFSGLNLGRWDYMASLIHFNLENPEWVLPDRNTIPHNVGFFQNLRELMPEICHKHGMLAIGGMTRSISEPRRRRIKCSRFESARGRQEERIDFLDGWRMDRPSRSERNRRLAISGSQSASGAAGNRAYASQSPAASDGRGQAHACGNTSGHSNGDSLSQRRAEWKRGKPARWLHGRPCDGPHLPPDDRAAHAPPRRYPRR